MLGVDAIAAHAVRGAAEDCGAERVRGQLAPVQVGLVARVAAFIPEGGLVCVDKVAWD